MPVLRLDAQRGTGSRGARCSGCGGEPTRTAVSGGSPGSMTTGDRKMLYEGSPSWKAYLGQYLLTAIAALVVVAVTWTIARDAVKVTTRMLAIVAPIGLAVLFALAIHIKRRSTRFRVTNTAIEYERGLISKRIDVLQLWRIRDVVYKQSLIDRVLGIAHVEVVAHDIKNPDFEIVGLPASRELFEQLRDSIEIQRQAKNVVGVVS